MERLRGASRGASARLLLTNVMPTGSRRDQLVFWPNTRGTRAWPIPRRPLLTVPRLLVLSGESCTRRARGRRASTHSWTPMPRASTRPPGARALAPTSEVFPAAIGQRALCRTDHTRADGVSAGAGDGSSDTPRRTGHQLSRPRLGVVSSSRGREGLSGPSPPLAASPPGHRMRRREEYAPRRRNLADSPSSGAGAEGVCPVLPRRGVMSATASPDACLQAPAQVLESTHPDRPPARPCRRAALRERLHSRYDRSEPDSVRPARPSPDPMTPRPAPPRPLPPREAPSAARARRKRAGPPRRAAPRCAGPGVQPRPCPRHDLSACRRARDSVVAAVEREHRHARA